MQKVAALLTVKKLSPFEFFCNLDVNFSGKISKIEFKTGLQAFGVSVNTKEFDVLWKMIKKPISKIVIGKMKEEGNAISSRRSNKRGGAESQRENEIGEMEYLSYWELLNGFVSAGCLKFQKSVDNTNNLVNKFRQQLKKRNISVEKAYKQFDPEE